MSIGGYNNDVLPLYAMLAVIGALGLRAAISWAAELPDGTRQAARNVVLAAAVLQFLLLTYNPAELVPTTEDRASGDRLIELIRGIEGDVYAPSHAYYPVMAGKRPFAHLAAIRQITAYFDDTEPTRREIVAEINEALDARRWAAIIMNDRTDHIERVRLAGRYRLAAEIPVPDRGPWPMTGKHTRPAKLWLPVEITSQNDTTGATP